MIRYDKLTLKSQEALQAAQAHAREKNNPQVAPEHLLWAMIEQKDGVGGLEHGGDRSRRARRGRHTVHRGSVCS